MALTKKRLEDLYVRQGISAPAAAKELGISRSMTYSLLEKYKIPRRQQQGGMVAGVKNPLWKGRGQLSQTFWGVICKKAAVRGIKVECSIEDAWDQFETQNGQCLLSGILLTLPL